MNATKAQLKIQFERAKRLGWLTHFEEAAAKYNFEPAFLLAIASRETNLDPKWLRNAGDGGHGFGLMQVDVGTDIEWIKTGKWKDAREGILRGTLVLSQKRTQLKGYKPGTPVKARDSGSKRWYSTPAVTIKKGDYETVLAGTFNGGSWPVYHYSKGRGSDYGTTGKDYGADVVARAAVFAQLLKQDAPRAETQAEDESPETTMPVAGREQDVAAVPDADAPPAPPANEGDTTRAPVGNEGEPALSTPAEEGQAVMGGRPSDPIIKLPSSLGEAQALIEKATPILQQGNDTTKKWATRAAITAALAAVWRWISDPAHFIPIAIFAGISVTILIVWWWTRYATKRDVRQLEAQREARAHELSLKKMELEAANAERLADPSRYNVVVDVGAGEPVAEKEVAV